MRQPVFKRPRFLNRRKQVWMSLILRLPPCREVPRSPNMNSLAVALEDSSRKTKLNVGALNRVSDYWDQVRDVYRPFDTAPKTGSADVYLHEMPGGQYTNLKAQAASMGVGHRWNEIAKTYADVNQLFGDIGQGDALKQGCW